VWAKLDALYVLAQQTQADALLNLVGTSYTLTHDSALFTQYSGFGPGGFNIGENTGFNPATAPSPKYIQNSGSLSIWTSSVGSGCGICNSTSSSQSTLAPATFGFQYYDINTNADMHIPAPGGNGLYGADRFSNVATYPYYNGIVVGVGDGNASAPVQSNNLLIGNRSDGGLAYTGIINEASIGGSLGDAGQLALYNRLRTYLTAVGVP
jgi:hypothetical protein